MEDDLERRIADLEGRPAQSIEPTVDAGEPDAVHGLGHWLRSHWMQIAIVVLTVFGYSLHKLGGIFPALDQPAPDWVGALFLALPVTAVAIYVVVRFIKSRR